MSDSAFADVILPIPVNRPFTYGIPASLRHRACVGMRAVVPFQKRVETGTIIGLRSDCDLESVRELIDFPDESPLYSAELLELCQWLADYYCCSWGEALQSAVPAGIAVRTKVRYVLQHDQIAAGRYTDRQRAVIAELHRRGPLTERQLAKSVGATALSNTLRSLVSRGLLRTESMAMSAGVSAQTDTYVCLVESAIPSGEDLAGLQRRAPKQAAVYLDLLNGEPERLAAHLYEKHGVNASVIRQLESRGLVARVEREYYRTPEYAGHGNAKHLLNSEQQEAFDAIAAAVRDRSFQTFLLQGITGSGKTEVYLQAIEYVLQQGRDAIILVPEISLTPQTVGRFKARFATDIAVLHSGLGAGERYDEWRRAHRGEVRIVVGARSAIFAPLPNVGIIIVDEEHDTSYKQSESPRYHARNVAIVRAQRNNAVCVLGSATPSVESNFNCDRGKSIRLILSERATRAKLPEVNLIDMRVETRESGPNAILSRRLEEAVLSRVKAGEQVLLLLNRRGFAPFVLCPQCGWVAECPDCNVSLTYHTKGAFLSCHYCNGRRQIPVVCDECHFNPLLFLGTGTQRVEDYLMRAFPGARVERMDADTTSGKGGHAKILGRLAEGVIDILIGTQMIAKGHDYPGVTLVGVINADTGLSLPDFRAAETTFQLLTQVAGRAGRGDRPGIVMIQTYRPYHYAMQTAAQHDYPGFYEREIKEREAALYPPFRRMANLMVECEDPEEAARAVAVLHRLVRNTIQDLGYQGIEILGPSPATVRRVKKKYRWNLGLLSKSAKRINTLCRAVRNDFDSQAKAQTQLKVDLDPYGSY
jgi:primosomal protein N' (replication factor Y)